MTDFGLKVLYIYEIKPDKDLSSGISTLHRRHITKGVLIGRRYFKWFCEDGLKLSEEEEILLNSSLVSCYE